MDRQDREQLRSVMLEVAGWVQAARAAGEARQQIEHAADAVTASLRQRVASVGSPGHGWNVLALTPSDEELLGTVAREAQSRLSPADAANLEPLLTHVPQALKAVQSSSGLRRLMAGRAKQAAAAQSAQFLMQYYAHSQLAGLPQLLVRLKPELLAQAAPKRIGCQDALADWIGLRERLMDMGIQAGSVVTIGIATSLPNAVEWIRRLATAVEERRAAAVGAGEAVRRDETRRILDEMPIERLREVSRERLRTNPLNDAGITTVQAVIDQEWRIWNLPGIGETSATRLIGAARHLERITYEEMPVRIDIARRSEPTGELLACLASWDQARRCTDARDEDLLEQLAGMPNQVTPEVTHLLVIPSGLGLDELGARVDAMYQRGVTISSTLSEEAQVEDPWADFMARPADYFAMLGELGFLVENEEKVHGDLTEKIIEAVRRLDFKTEHLRASLRGYQDFGARFAVVQRRVILGDEMGLGKTVEALAALAHLRACGDQWFFVICPAAVVTNWMREVTSKTTLGAHRLHGVERRHALNSWKRNGGVAVTTFETLGWLEGQDWPLADVACVVVDEAHYIKRPESKRTQRTTRLLEEIDRAVLLTGTPLENKLVEFRRLVGYLRPDLLVDGSEFAHPRRFRKEVAPAYLRRNTEDVLVELPELFAVEEWLPMSDLDTPAYRAAVAEGNFMAMRQAAMLNGEESEKVCRLIELVEEAAANGRKTIVFSYFLAVLDQVVSALPAEVFGPLTGSVPPNRRQEIVDAFSGAPDGAVLVSQILAGGIGLNIQAASVVIICEPQVKPTMEWQAIARAHRMGQLHPVQVHRLLSDEGVDLRITEILAKKAALFEEFARESDTAQAAPEAFDISEAELAREIVAAERRRLFPPNMDPAR